MASGLDSACAQLVYRHLRDGRNKGVFQVGIRTANRAISEIDPHRAAHDRADSDDGYMPLSAHLRKHRADHDGRHGHARQRFINKSLGRTRAARAEGIMKPWMNVAEGAEYSGVSRDTIYTACERGELRHTRVGGRRVIRLKPEWIDAWLEQHARGAEAVHVMHVSTRGAE